MFLNKIFTIILLYGGVLSYAQPSPQKLICELELTFGDTNEDRLSFYTEDSIHCFSTNKKYELELYLIKDTSKGKDTIPLITNRYSLSNNIYDLRLEEDVIKLKYIFFASYNNLPMLESTLIMLYRKKREEMNVLIDFTDSREDLKLKKLFISFKKGSYSVTNPKTLEIIKGH